MKCSKCGAELKEGDKFCGSCGADVVIENSEEKKVEEDTNTNLNVDVKKEQSTCTIFGIVGLCLSFFINILSLPFSIIAMVKGSKLKKVTNKTETGFVLGLIGTILSVLFFIFWIFVFTLAIIGVKNTVDKAKDIDLSNIEEKLEETIEDNLEDKKKVGNSDLGYIYIPEDWHESDPGVDDENMIQYGDEDNDQMLSMTVFKQPSFTLEQYRTNLENLLKKDNENGGITAFDTYISNYTLKVKKIGGKYQGKYLYTWTFADSNNNVYYIALESTDYDNDVFSLVDNYKLPEGVKIEKTAY